ncbi:signal transduction histidine kinase [Allocatelliglobosispora scoriae]|uniref:histidine kinase n=1 Tax=Allocatelliglobosispora scoriae TaxID=643052 RepID=A0A841BHV9_9ACTN|nr:histidine kinase [Allocatelliglobosispora scoriae]MBB5866918.1 signal transduction histidine kinase [Allocatelliglobosispora scoriae]
MTASRRRGAGADRRTVIIMVETGRRWLRAWRVAARRPPVVDAVFGAALAASVLVAMVTGPGRGHGRSPGTADFVAAGLMFVLVALRRRWPLPVLAVATSATVVAFAAGGMRSAVIVATVIAAYTVASIYPRRTAWLAGGAAALIMYAASVRWSNEGWAEPENIGIFAWTGMATAVGDATRSRRAYIAAVEERARRAEQTREEEARTRVVQERLRIARELHDVVAHNIAVINVQAGVAAHVLRARPDAAEQALQHIRTAARSVLDELGTVLGVLRQPDDAEAATEPTPGLGRLAELLDSLAAAGLRVEYRLTGEARPLSAAVDLTAYRIAQEALTNAHKHGADGVAHLRVEYTPDALTLEVGNAVPHPARPAGGTSHGIIGMSERAASVGGTLSTGIGTDGQFRVRAVLPTPRSGASDRQEAVA